MVRGGGSSEEIAVCCVNWVGGWGGGGLDL
jgi:hypothetical protein